MELCLYTQVHQPYRLRKFGLFEIGTGAGYFDDDLNRDLLTRIAGKCYRPATALLAELIGRGEADFRIALSMTGTLIEQLEAWDPETLERFQQLVATGRVDLLGETYEHSLAALASDEELVEQVAAHRALIGRVFGVVPTVFRGTELIYWDGLAPTIERLGFRAVVVEGADQILDGRSPNRVYRAAGTQALRLLPRNYRLSDDVGFRFSSREWDGWPLTADTYADWLERSGGQSVHLGIDFETLGEHHWSDTGIFEFLACLPAECARRGVRFVHPGDLASREPAGELSFERPTSWADIDRDVTAWLGNTIQVAAQARLYGLRDAVRASGHEQALRDWRRLSTSDHLYYMCTKWSADGDVHAYFSPYDTPYDAYVTFMNVLQDLEQRVAPTAAGRPADAGAAAR